MVAIGFFVALPLAIPIDPRKRMQSPKMNPSRVFTPEGQVGWGGSAMALYNVESPGGYMNTGLSIPCADILGWKQGYSSSRPWLMDDFDQITFREVSEEEHARLLALFHAGRYEYEIQDVVFDMAEHNKLLESTKEELESIRKAQRKAQDELAKKERELLEKWTKEKEADKPSFDEVQDLMNEKGVRAISAPLNANVWKVTINEGDKVEAGGKTTLAILEAMKLEIPVKSEEEASEIPNDGEEDTVVKILVKPGDVVQAGNPLMLIKRNKK